MPLYNIVVYLEGETRRPPLAERAGAAAERSLLKYLLMKAMTTVENQGFYR